MTAGYLLDSNVLIAAKNSYYSFDLCPGFWEALLAAHKAERIFSLDRVEVELRKGDDDLVDWVSRLPKGFFLGSTDADSVKHFAAMQQWAAKCGQFGPSARDEFARVADGWLMATAKAKGHTLVTQERYRADAKRKVPMPNVCKQFAIAYMDTFDMLRTLRASFVLRMS